MALTLWHKRVETLYALSHLIFTIALLGNFHYYPYLREEEIILGRLGKFPSVSELVNSGAIVFN